VCFYKELCSVNKNYKKKNNLYQELTNEEDGTKYFDEKHPACNFLTILFSNTK